MITFLNNVLNSYTMLLVWFVPFLAAVMAARKRGKPRFYLLAVFCVPFLIYFTWASTGLWSTHLVALAFNRSAQVTGVIVLLIFMAGLYEHK
jgi:hypothetical protein